MLEHQNKILIYPGGPDFSVAMPHAVLLDDTSSRDLDPERLAVADIDGDSLPDILHLNEYSDRSHTLKIYFGRGTLPLSGDQADRSIKGFGDDYQRLDLADVDGDGVQDVLTSKALYLSSHGKNARWRPFDADDADLRFVSESEFTHMLGPLNDSTGRFSMVGAFDYDVLHAYSGGPTGPDMSYDGTYSATSAYPFSANCSSLGDVNGDGWSDVLFSNSSYPGHWNWGIALILAGGSYIPHDWMPTGIAANEGAMPSMSVVRIWPVPTESDVTVSWPSAWTQTPSTIELYASNGDHVQSLSVEERDKAATLALQGLPAGRYIVLLRSQSGAVLGWTTAVRR